ncbi:hypothetical protein HK100_010204 [Physocladia obscura]|uniref:tRNA-dihydrouridine(16/17) synthase [NAD(P)(+)] n=1 Tax=Physocladia obscura TaxID=109957 RepID=A0AAD5T3V3_9FUNG|nr:hypothetical protein HK100_010204 [Physocladia obscura]
MTKPVYSQDAQKSNSPRKLESFEFYQNVLGSPKHIVAPMVDHSEYAWRILSRKYGAELCYTPMFHARLFAENEQYRTEQFVTGPNDRPLIVQFCANDAETLLKAAKLVENDCDAVDLNLGCPQGIAKRGHYGSFLMEDWDLICEMVSTLHKNLAVPVTCKIRVYPDVNKTIEYAKRLQAAGCQILTVHGRTREMKGHKTGIADWEQIRRVKAALQIPVFANGNICYFEDVGRCLEVTECDGVMTAEGNLYNPALFSGELPPIWRIAEEYLQICTNNPGSANFGMMRAHLFKIFAPCLPDFTDLRTDLALKHTMEDFWEITREIKKRILTATNNAKNFTPPAKYELDARGLRILPNWICQPHFRPELPSSAPASNENSTDPAAASTAGESTSDVDPAIAKARIKRKELRRQAKLDKIESEEYINAKKARKAAGKNPVCASAKCLNYGSSKCVVESCKNCCRERVQVKKIVVLEVGEGCSGNYICEAHKSLPWKE